METSPASALPATEGLVTKRILKGWPIWLSTALCVFLGVFELYGLYVYPFDPWVFRAMFLMIASILVFIHFPTSRKSISRVTWIDMILMVLAVVNALYLFINFDELLFRVGGSRPPAQDVVMGCIALVLLFECLRRCSGWALPIIGVVFILYALAGPYLPGMLWHRGYNFDRIISFLYSTGGVYSIPLGTTCYYVYIFILFGTIMQYCGTSDFFVNLAKSLTAGSRGSVGKMPLLSSMLFGTVSGAAVANVVLTGSITIPTMKKSGFEADTAGAIEAVCSTGGQLMPPVMGAAAFLMAEMLNVSYGVIVVAAVIPSFLYYLAIYFMIDLEAAKKHIGADDEKTSTFKELMVTRGYLLIPLLIMIFSLIYLNVSPNRAALYGILSTVVISAFHPSTRIPLKAVPEIFGKTGRDIMEISITTAGAGIVVGILSLTGLGIKFASIITTYASGSLFLALIMSMVVCIVLGMGLPTVAAYATVAAVIPPALQQFGVSPLAGHFFIFFFCVLGTITPPVAVASYAAAAVAQANVWTLSMKAVRYGLAGFIIPFMFVYGEGLLFRGNTLDIITAVISSSFGIYCLACALQGWMRKALSPVLRVMLFIASLSLIFQGIYTDLLGLSLLVCIYLYQRYQTRTA